MSISSSESLFTFYIIFSLLMGESRFLYDKKAHHSWICLHLLTLTQLRNPHTTAPSVRAAKKRRYKRVVLHS